MTKRRSALHAEQLAFTFDLPQAARHEADLAGLDRMVAAGVGRALKEDPRSRPVIAGAMTALLADDVTPYMLDAYASESREQHNISFGRFLVLIAVTERFDILDALITRIGARVLVGEEMHTARLGHLRSQLKELQQALRDAERQARPITRGGRG